jgi:hypothetical protein
MNRRLKKRGSDKPLSSGVLRSIPPCLPLGICHAKFQCWPWNVCQPRLLRTKECIWHAPPSLMLSISGHECERFMLSVGICHFVILTDSSV